MPHSHVDHARVLLSLAFAAPGDGLPALAAADWTEIDRLAARAWSAARKLSPGPDDQVPDRPSAARRLVPWRQSGQRIDAFK